MTSLASTIASYALDNVYTQEDAVLVRQGQGTWSRGVFTAVQEAGVDVKLVSAPVSPQVRETLPEGFRESSLLTFWLKEDVSAIEEGNTIGDDIVFDGGTYKVIKVHHWGGFNEAIGTLITRP